MAFTKYSKIGSALTFDRENSIFANIIEDGIFSGMQVYGGSGFDISIQGGYFAKNGIVWRDNATSTDVLTVPAPSTDEHHIIWVDVSTDSPSYNIKSGTYASPAELTPLEAANGLIIAHIWVASTATNILECAIANMDKVSSKEKPQFFITAETLRVSEPSAGTVRIKTLNVRALRFGENNGRNFSSLAIQNSNNFDVSGVTQRYFVLFTRSLSGWSDDTETSPIFYAQLEDSLDSSEGILALQGYDAGYVAATDKDVYPYRPNLQDIIILAILDRTRNACLYPQFGVSPEGGGVNGGQLESMISSFSSTSYSTSETGPSVDIDDIITNLSVIKSAGLQEVYEAMGDGVSDASRIIEVGKPVEIHSTNMSSPEDVLDAWGTSLRVGVDVDSDNGVSGLMRGIDVVSNYRNKIDKGILVRRPITINGKYCINTSISLIDGTTRVEINSINSITPLDLIVEYGQKNATIIGKKIYLQLLNSSPYNFGETVGAIFRLGVDAVNNVFYLISANDDYTTVLPSSLTNFSYPQAVNATLWDGRNEISHYETSVNRLTVTGAIQGIGGAILDNAMILRGVGRQDVSNSSANERRVAPIRIGRRGYKQEVYDNGSSVSGSRMLFTDGAYLIDVEVSNASPIVVNLRKDDSGVIIGSFSTDTDASSIKVGHSSIYTTSFGVIVCVPCGYKVEFWLYNFATQAFTKEYSYDYGDGATTECRTSLMIGDFAAWVGGDYSALGGGHNAALYELGTGIIDYYRFGKNNNCELYGKAFETDGYHMAVTAINGVTPASGAVQCVILNDNGSVGETTMIRGSWTNDILAPVNCCITDKYIIVYGTGTGQEKYIERYPIYKGLFGNITDSAPYDSLQLNVATDLTIDGIVYGKSTGFILVGKEFNIGSGTPAYAYIMEFDESSQNMNTKMCITEDFTITNFKSSVYAFNGMDVFVLSTVDNKCYKYCVSSTGKMVEAPASGFISRRAFRVME